MDLLTGSAAFGILLLSLTGCYALLRRARSGAASSTPVRSRARNAENELTDGRLDELDRRMKALQLEWTDSYERLLRMSRRFAKLNETPEPSSTNQVSTVIPQDGRPINRLTLLARARAAGIPLTRKEVGEYNATGTKQTPNR